MDKLEFTFDEELFGAFQRGDVKTMDAIETAIKDFLNDDDIEEIRAGDEYGFERCADFLQVCFNTRAANRDDKKDEFIVLKIQDRANTDEIPDAYFFSSEPIYITIERGDKLVLDKYGRVAHIGWESWAEVSDMMYKDKCGRLFKVVWQYEGRLKGRWRAYYKKPGSSAWRVTAALPVCWSREAAEKELAEYAARHDMQVVDE